jgi:hypothetical protein
LVGLGSSSAAQTLFFTPSAPLPSRIISPI